MIIGLLPSFRKSSISHNYQHHNGHIGRYAIVGGKFGVEGQNVSSGHVVTSMLYSRAHTEEAGGGHT
jgi:hypothetical protein